MSGSRAIVTNELVKETKKEAVELGAPADSRSFQICQKKRGGAVLTRSAALFFKRLYFAL